jgi:histidinol dehydrogenase
LKILQGGPLKAGWQRLSAQRRQAVVARCEVVRRQGDRALRKGRPLAVKRRALAVERRALRQAFGRLSPQARAALELACRHAGALARRELAALKEFDLKPTTGLSLYQRLLPLDSVGILVPARRVSAVLAGAIPAALAGVSRRVVCAAPGPGGEVDPHVLAAAYMCDVTELHAVEGVDGVAALAYGTESIGPVSKIVGMGDATVAVAKRQILDVCSVALATGPTELLVLADDTAAPEFVAVDLLAQAALDPEGSCVLVTTSRPVAEATRAVLRKRLHALGAGHPARGTIRRAQAAVVKGLTAAVDLANGRAPQRLSLLVKRPDELAPRLRSYGTLLVGPHTPASLAERVTGVGALQPAWSAAHRESAVSVSDFLRRVTVQQVDPSAYLRLSRAAATLAELEGADQAILALNERILSADASERQ